MSSDFKIIKDYTKIIQKIFKTNFIISCFYNYISGSTSSVAYLLDPAIKQLYRSKRKYDGSYSRINCFSLCCKRYFFVFSKIHNDQSF